ncbi:MAG: translation initiation factor IF-3 [Thermodesulfovibrionales bacterium]|nr:translation initiation factor IF-3 [Thermodesulfovibrionales bacterium]
MNKEVRVNQMIKAKEVRLIDEEGKQIGLLPVEEAIQIAKERGYDLVEVAPNANPPVCKIVDYGKYKYQVSKKHSAKKVIDVKEIKIRPHISEHDLSLKAKHIRRFLDDGDKAKIVMYFRGREIVRPEMGMKVFERLLELITGKFNIEVHPKFEGNHIVMVIAPSSK